MFKFEFCNEQKIEKLQQIECDAVLDQKWFHDVLITATSLGNVEFYKLKNFNLENSHKISLDETSECLVLSIDADLENNKILASDSLGRLTLIDGSIQKVVSQWKCHDFEAWTCSFDFWNSNVVYSGMKYEATIKLYSFK